MRNILGSLYVALIVVLITAKLVGYVHWAWGWVLAPLWGPFALFAIGAIILIAFFARESSAGRNPFN